MMSWVIVCLVALVASGLTLFSGFGLGTLLLPAFAVLFPIEIAVAATGVVHLLNNIFKLGLVGRHADWSIVLRFGLTAILGAGIGAWLLGNLASLPEIYRYTLFDKEFVVGGLELVIAILILCFAIADLLPSRGDGFSSKWAPVGGLLSGFFGGVSGHQGALRSAFLVRFGLTKEAFVGTGVVCAVLIDCARLAVYGATFLRNPFQAVGAENGWPLVAAATVSAFLGAYLGVRWMGKVTLDTVRRIVATALLLMAIAMGLGWIQ